MSDEVQAAMFADGERSIPLRHVAAPEEIAHALLFAATNPYTTGTILDPNGGLHLGRVSTQSEEDPAHRWLRERINELATEVASPELPLRKEDR